ncbi:hypothetical protein JTF08_07560 [Micrococcaceae bacterium RIT802]|nr:hypothetical protein [Micrococcaceae bacterium RIT 802]
MSADFFETLRPGERIVVRFRLAGQSPALHDGGAAAASRGPHLSDVIGNFVSLDDTGVVIKTRSGPVTVSRDDVTHAKRVPPPPPRRRAARER